jgi:hypothetical protein
VCAASRYENKWDRVIVSSVPYPVLDQRRLSGVPAESVIDVS